MFGAIRSEVGTSDNPRKFTGKEYESDVRLYYFDARYYDPYIGRFITRDPIGDGVNWYAYAANNPLKFVDPTGLEWIWVDGEFYYRVPWWEKLLNAIRRATGMPPIDPNDSLPSGPPMMPGGVIVGEPEVPKFDPKSLAVKAVIDLIFGPVSPNHEEQLQTDRGLKDEIDRRGGYENLGRRDPGNPTNRHLGGGDQAAQDFFGHLRGNRAVATHTNKETGAKTYVGTDPDGNTIAYRSTSKGKPGDPGYTGAATVSVFKGKKEIKLRFGDDD